MSHRCAHVGKPPIAAPLSQNSAYSVAYADEAAEGGNVQLLSGLGRNRV